MRLHYEKFVIPGGEKYMDVWDYDREEYTNGFIKGQRRTLYIGYDADGTYGACVTIEPDRFNRKKGIALIQKRIQGHRSGRQNCHPLFVGKIEDFGPINNQTRGRFHCEVIKMMFILADDAARKEQVSWGLVGALGKLHNRENERWQAFLGEVKEMKAKWDAEEGWMADEEKVATPA